MPKIIKTLDEYVATVRIKDTLFIVFDTQFNISITNDRDKNMLENLSQNPLSDEEAREEFIQFMQENFPNIELVEVMESFWGSYLGCVGIHTILQHLQNINFFHIKILCI